MVFSMVGKLLLKATIPFVIIAGVISYGMYSKGGDPMAMWKGFGSGISEQLAGMFSNAKDDASNVAGAVADVANGGTMGSVAAKLGASKRTQVFSWKDANGVTNYGTVAPAGANSTELSINPNRNVMAPVEAPKSVRVRSSGSNGRMEDTADDLSPSAARNQRQGASGERQTFSDPAVQEVADQLGGELPGIAGQILSTQGNKNGAGLDPMQLLKMLQQ